MTDLALVSSLARAATHPDPAFPRFHPRPAQGWINDPNGVSYIDGKYHVFFQYNPDSARHRLIQWGHVSSEDLVQWEEHPVALVPQAGGPDSAGCWTGVVTLDDGVPTAAYSGVQDHGGHSQVVIARGSSDLVSWNQDGHVAASMPTDPTVTAVRDPFIFRFNGARYAVQGAGLADGRAALLLYSVEDMENWEYKGIWLTSSDPVAAMHAPAEIWECPQLVEVPVAGGGSTWVMMFSLWLSGDDHEHANGVGHLIGSLSPDSETGLPVFTAATGGKSDLGRDFYAPQIVQLAYSSAAATSAASSAAASALMWGWANEGPGRDGRRGRTQEEIDDAGWSGVLTHPRLLSVADGALVVAPAPEVSAYRGAAVASDASGSVDVPAFAEVGVTGSGPVSLRLGSGADEQLVYSGTVAAGEELRIFIDASLVEVYRSGSVATTLRAYPLAGESWTLELPAGATANVWELTLPR
ncbi:glycoside hydrolase family 32 protein [Paenarthrobacter sp. AT5]|uniref:glycoside hydrolase family 32 protein n=1 Tax=Paenarthrobacter TaxID=1742992 RepID=UPI001A97EC7B|nr:MULTISPECIES: glycoside hydrolase family 32 protein [Paenarthrobacter]QSZ53014.1 glycosyl hydrolase family 32 [Paenarthrobacter ureafaciens]WOC60173.1 glycoside hydrolase family 32 protein [Paenarthrobacter sp. AT5]